MNGTLVSEKIYLLGPLKCGPTILELCIYSAECNVSHDTQNKQLVA